MSYKYKIKDEKTGEEKEIDVFTQEEVDAKAKEASEKAVTEKQTEFDKTLSEKEEEHQKALEEATKGGDDKGDDKDKTIEELQKKVNDLTTRIDGDFKSDLLNKLSGGDEDVKKKIEHEYNQFGGDITDKTQIEERMLKAAKLAIPNESPSTLDEAIGYASKRGQAPEGEKPDAKIGEETKKQGKNFGISDEDYEKYGDKIDSVGTPEGE